MVSTAGTSDSDGDSMPGKTDQVRGNKSAFTLSKPKIIRDEFGWPLMTDEAGKSYDFKLQLTFQYPMLPTIQSPSSTFLTAVVPMQRVICVQQTDSDTFITTSDGPAH
jgi:hypothetical protein